MSDWQTLFTVYGICFVVLIGFVLSAWDKSSDRYKRCLASIDRLERELFPLFELKPGAMWQVDDPNCVQVWRYHFYGYLTEPRTESPCP